MFCVFTLGVKTGICIPALFLPDVVKSKEQIISLVSTVRKTFLDVCLTCFPFTFLTRH